MCENASNSPDASLCGAQILMPKRHATVTVARELVEHLVLIFVFMFNLD
jgi:hypothetical protein